MTYGQIWRIDRYPLLPRSRRYDGLEVRLLELGVWGVVSVNGDVLFECGSQREGEKWADLNCPPVGSQ